MSGSAKITSIDAIESFRIALIKFDDNATRSLTSVDEQIKRVLHWFEHEAPTEWGMRIRKCHEEVARTRAALETCKMKKVGTIAGLHGRTAGFARSPAEVGACPGNAGSHPPVDQPRFGRRAKTTGMGHGIAGRFWTSRYRRRSRCFREPCGLWMLMSSANGELRQFDFRRPVTQAVRRTAPAPHPGWWPVLTVLFFPDRGRLRTCA